ncbi:MAG: hypothetical protein LBB53_00050, partial [Prevotellaceae bacterium]|nr:hypothetical protein [Prevotellaceae bacterium]
RFQIFSDVTENSAAIDPDAKWTYDENSMPSYYRREDKMENGILYAYYYDNGYFSAKIPLTKKPVYSPKKTLLENVDAAADYAEKTKYDVVLPNFADLPRHPELTSSMSIEEVKRLVSEYRRNRDNVLKEVSKQMGKIRDFYTNFINRGRPLEKYLEQMEKAGADIMMSEKTDAYNYFVRSASIVTNLMNKYQKTEIKPLQDILKKAVEKLPQTSYRWNILDSTGELVNGKELSNYDKISIYLQAKDIVEAEQLGLVDRGRGGFENDVRQSDGSTVSPEQYISEFEAAVGDDLINNIWNKVRSVNRFALDLQLEYGLITADTYAEYTDGNREYYVPERGWRERDLRDEKLYYVADKSASPDNPFHAALVKARGRTTLAGDPLAYMQSIGESTIMSCIKNKNKQVFLEFAFKNIDFAHKYKFFDLKKVWYVKSYALDENGSLVPKLDGEGNQIYEHTYTEPSQELIKQDKETKEQIKELDRERKTLTKKHIAHEITDEVFENAVEKLNLKEKELLNSINVKWFDSEADALQQRTSKEKQQHVVSVLKDGITYEIEFKSEYGGERVANVLNRNFGYGQNTELELYKIFLNVFKRGTRLMSALRTQYNPGFAVVNTVRDLGTATVSNLAEFGLQYQLKFMKNLTLVQKTVWQYAGRDNFNGKYGFSDNKYGKLLQEFFEDGAATGWSFLKDIKELRKDMQSSIDPSVMKDYVWGGNYGAKNFFGLKHVFATLTEASELQTRFAEYATSREMGYTREQAAMHAKDVTVNFDVKGTDKVFSSLFSFFNACIQGSNKLFVMMRDRRVRRVLIGVFSSYFVGGIMQAMFMPDPDDDDDREFTEWELMNNICVGRWKMPLPQVFRGFWGAGVQIGLAAKGAKKVDHSLLDAALFFLGEVVPEQLIFFVNGFEFDEKSGAFQWDDKKGMRGFVPTTLQPLYDIIRNTNYLGGTSYRTEFTNKLQDTQAEHSLGKKNASAGAKFIANKVWELGGGTFEHNARAGKDGKLVKKIFDWNPSKIQTLAEGYGGGPLRFASDLIDLASQIYEGKDIDVSKIQVANIFVKQPREYTALDNDIRIMTAKADFWKTEFDSIKSGKKEAIAEAEKNGDIATAIKLKNEAYKNFEQKISYFTNEKMKLLNKNREQFEKELWNSKDNWAKKYYYTHAVKNFNDELKAGTISKEYQKHRTEELLREIEKLE